MSGPILQRFSRGLLEKRWITGSMALLLLAISLLVAWQWERRETESQIRQAAAQAEMLAGSLSGALAFDDRQTIREYLSALQLNRSVRAAGIYAENGELVAGYTQQGENLPVSIAAGSRYLEGGQLSIAVPVREGDLELGHVFLRTSIEPLSARLSRYVALGIVLILAALLITILGASNAAAAAANRELQKQIAAREQAETALRQAQKMEALGQLTGGVAHDFNNLLMAASSGLALLQRAKDESRRETLRLGIKEALDRGARITEQLLAFSRRRPLKVELVRMDEHVGKLAALLDHSLRENISVDFSIPPGIWPVEVDVAQFDIAILNVAVNAKDAMPRGGELHIAARNVPYALDGTDAVELSIEDSGEGIPPELLEKVFEPFFTTKEQGRGTGLGLSQVYGFARAAGGTIRIESTPGKGTRIELILPKSGRSFDEARPPSDGTSKADLTGVRVLLVEDDKRLNQLISDMLEEEGSQVLRATNGNDGLRLASEHSPKIVLSDMVMPGGMSGLEMARAIRAQDPDIPIILMTGYSEETAAAEAEGFPLLRKPFTMPSMTEQLQRSLRAREPGAAIRSLEEG